MNVSGLKQFNFIAHRLSKSKDMADTVVADMIAVVAQVVGIPVHLAAGHPQADIVREVVGIQEIAAAAAAAGTNMEIKIN